MTCRLLALRPEALKSPQTCNLLHFHNRPDDNLLDLQVGASNELPESEELDALYDRFLLRRKVEQVSSYGLSELLSDSNLGRAAFHSGEERDALSGTQDAIASSSEQILDISQDLFKTIR